jgi:hypothetical protein
MDVGELLARPVMWMAGISRTEGQEARTEQLVNLLESAQKSVRIVSGQLPEDVYNDDAYNAMGEVLRRGGTVDVILGPRADNKASLLPLEVLRRLAPEQAHYYMVDQEPGRHYAIIDEKHTRLETRHSPGEDRTQYVIRSYKDAKLLTREFDHTASQLTPIDPVKLGLLKD